jgi:hypothetical protein
MAAEITEDEEGKSVLSSDGEEVGVVIDVQYGTARVEPDPGLTDELKARVGFGDTDEESYPPPRGAHRDDHRRRNPTTRRPLRTTEIAIEVQRSNAMAGTLPF